MSELPVIADPHRNVLVVVVDDSKTIRRSAEVFLTQAGYKVLLVDDGFKALGTIVDSQPQIVFVDVMMPRLDGYQTCSLIKRNPEFSQVPVIMLTSKDGLFDRARGKLAGCDDYLVKPFTREALIDVIDRHVVQVLPNGAAPLR